MAKTETMENTAMVKSGYAALANNDLMAELAEDLTGLTLRYDRVKIPSAASPVFEVPGENGESEMVKELRGVIVLQHPPRDTVVLLRHAGLGLRPGLGGGDFVIEELRGGIQLLEVFERHAPRGGNDLVPFSILQNLFLISGRDVHPNML